MDIYSNTEKLAFRISGCRERLLPIRFSGTEALSALYRFDILLLSDEELDCDAAIGRQGTLSITSADGAAASVRSGMVTGLSLERTAKRWRLYRATLEPRFTKMRQGLYTRLFLGNDQDNPLGGKPIREIFPELCQRLELDADAWDFSALSSLDFKRQHICQYNESNYDFCARWMEYLGVFFYFEHTENGETLIALHQGAGPSAVPETFTFHSGQGLNRNAGQTISRFASRQTLLPQSLRVRDFNPDTPSLTIAAKRPVDAKGKGDVYLFNEFLRSPDEAAFIATMRAEQLNAGRRVFQGEADSAALMPGRTFSLRTHPNAAFNAAYMVTSARLCGDQSGRLADILSMSGFGDLLLEKQPACRSEFACIPAATQYRPPLQTPVPTIAGVIQAVVDAEQGETYAELDKEGRYKVSFPFENFAFPRGRASCFVRMAQPYAGSRNGMHFPLLKGTEVAIGFTGGNVDRPYIECALPNARNISVSTQNNPSQGKIVSIADNSILYEDLSGRERIEMHNPDTETLVAYGWFGANYGVLKSTPNTYADFLSGQRHTVVSGAGSYDGKTNGLYRFVGGDYFLKVQTANRIEKTSGASAQSTKQNRNATIHGDQTLNVTGDIRLSVADNLIEDIGGDRSLTAKSMEFSAKDDYWLSESFANTTCATDAVFKGHAATAIDMKGANIFMSATDSHADEVANTYTEQSLVRMVNTVTNTQKMENLTRQIGVDIKACGASVTSNSLSFKTNFMLNASLDGALLAYSLTKIELTGLKASIAGTDAANKTEALIKLKAVKMDVAAHRNLVIGKALMPAKLLTPVELLTGMFPTATIWPFLVSAGIPIVNQIHAKDISSFYDNMVQNAKSIQFPNPFPGVNPIKLASSAVENIPPLNQNAQFAPGSSAGVDPALAADDANASADDQSLDAGHAAANALSEQQDAANPAPVPDAAVAPQIPATLDAWNHPEPEDKPFTHTPSIPSGNP